MPSTRPTVDPVLDILEELGYDFDELDGDGYKRSIREAIFKTHPDTGGKTADPEKFQILNEEFKKIRRGGSKPPEVEVKEKKSTIKGAKLLPGRGNFSADDIKPVDIEKKKEGDAPALMPDRLDNIANTVDSIALLLRRQFGLEKKQQRDTKKQQDKINKDAREDKLEGKPKDKKTGLIPNAIKKPALNFFDKIKTFFTNVVLGAGVIKLFEWLKDPANQENITKFKDFLINNATWIVGGLAALALLPVVGGLVGLIGGIMGGLSLFGLTIPLLPIILKGILIAAVLALTIAAGNAIKNKLKYAIVGTESFSKGRDKNLKILESKGLTKSGRVIDPDTGEEIYVKRWEGDTGASGDDKYGSIEGRPWGPGDKGKNSSVKINLNDAESQDWYGKFYGPEKLEEKLAALNLYKKTKKDFETKKEEMFSEIREKTHVGGTIELERDSYSNAEFLAISKIEDMDERKKKLKEFRAETKRLQKEEKAKIHERYGKLLQEEYPHLFSSVDSSANISEDIKPKDVNLTKNSKSGGVTIIDGGNGGGNGGAYGGEANASETMISSEDNNNSDIITTSTTYGTGG